MEVTLCDMCKRPAQKKSELISFQPCEDIETGASWWTRKTFDLCEDCAGKMQEMITGVFPERIVPRGKPKE